MMEGRGTEAQRRGLQGASMGICGVPRGSDVPVSSGTSRLGWRTRAVTELRTQAHEFCPAPFPLYTDAIPITRTQRTPRTCLERECALVSHAFNRKSVQPGPF